MGREKIAQKKDKEQTIEFICNDNDVQLLFWSCITGMISEEAAQELLQEVVKLWVSIRGFSIAAAYVEAYKISYDKVTQKKKDSERN